MGSRAVSSGDRYSHISSGTSRKALCVHPVFGLCTWNGNGLGITHGQLVQGHPEDGHLEEEVSGGKLEQLTTVPMEVLEALWERYS